MLRRLLLLAVFSVAALQTGCAVNRATATVEPSLKWDSIKALHVVKEI